MSFNIDAIIIALFLVINLAVGIYFGQGIKTIRDFAVGDRQFASASIAATIIATWISGSFFSVSISQLYREGVWFIPAALGDILSLLIISHILAPRMKQFLNHLSVAETMGALYGKQIRVVTAVTSIAQAVAMTALQIKVFASVFSYFFNFAPVTATIASSFVVICYSTWGGIKSVALTDVFQFFTFGLLIPLFAVFIWQSFGDMDKLVTALHTNPLLDLSELINYHDPKFFPNLCLMLWFLIPSMNSPTFQRALMARNTTQIYKSFNLAALGYAFIIAFICLIGLLILALEPNLDANSVVVYVVDHYAFPGLKGLTVIGIVAMVMSTADSWINVGAVIFSHDLCHSMGLKFKNELLISRIFTIFTGVASVIMVLSTPSLFKLFSLQANFYMPIITMPLIFSILGFRTAPYVMATAMFVGGLSVVLWRIYIMPHTGIDSVVPAMLANLLTFLGMHYLLGEQGGFVGNSNNLHLHAVRLQRQRRFAKLKTIISNLPQKIMNFSFIEYCNTHHYKSDLVYTYFALVSLFSVVTTVSLDGPVYEQHLVLIHSIQFITLFIVAIFLGNKLWPTSLRTKYFGLIWHIAIFVNLAFVSSLLVLISNLSQVSLVILIFDLTLIGILLNWQMALVMAVVGVWGAFLVYQAAYHPFTAEIDTLKLKIAYLLMAVAGFMIAFLKPKQEHQELLEEQKNYIDLKLSNQQKALREALDLKYEFLRNLEHETNTPITGITSMGMVLYDNFDKLSKEQIKAGLKDIAYSSTRLTSLVQNLVGLSKLMQDDYTLNMKKFNLTEVIYERLELCKKLYMDEEKNELQHVIFDDNTPITIEADKHSIEQLLDNLIINAIQYCPAGEIIISVRINQANEVEFSIKDEGIGIDKKELYDVFGVFVVSSRTKTPSGGRGIGLALCKKIVELHRGRIWVEQNPHKGVTFFFSLPKTVSKKG